MNNNENVSFFMSLFLKPSKKFPEKLRFQIISLKKKILLREQIYLFIL